MMLQILASPFWASKKWVPFSRHHPLLTLSFKCQHEVEHVTEKQTWPLEPNLCHSSDLSHMTTMKLTPRFCVDIFYNVKYVQSKHFMEAVNFWLKLNLGQPILLPHEGFTIQIAMPTCPPGMPGIRVAARGRG